MNTREQFNQIKQRIADFRQKQERMHDLWLEESKLVIQLIKEEGLFENTEWKISSSYINWFSLECPIEELPKFSEFVGWDSRSIGSCRDEYGELRIDDETAFINIDSFDKLRKIIEDFKLKIVASPELKLDLETTKQRLTQLNGIMEIAK